MQVQLFTDETDLLLAILYKNKLIYNIIPAVYTARLEVMTISDGGQVSIGIGHSAIIDVGIDDYWVKIGENRILFKHCTDEQYNVTINF